VHEVSVCAEGMSQAYSVNDIWGSREGGREGGREEGGGKECVPTEEKEV
jgi:hypothetical protein